MPPKGQKGKGQVKSKSKGNKHSKGKGLGVPKYEEGRRDEEEVQVIPDEEEEEEEPEDLGPPFNPVPFAFLFQRKDQLIREKEETTWNRRLRVGLHLLDNAHGSVKYWQGGTQVLAAVFGPTDVRMSKELPHRAAVDVLFRPKTMGNKGLGFGWDPVFDERAVEGNMASVLETVLFLEEDAGSGYNVILHELDDHGCLFSTLVNATCFSLLNSGAPMRFMFAGVTVLIDEERDAFVVDPSDDELKKGKSALLHYVISSKGNILYSSIQGKTNFKLLKLGLRTAFSAVDELFQFMREVVEQDLSEYTAESLGNGLLKMQIDDEDVKVKAEEKPEFIKEEEDDSVDSDSSIEEIEDGEVINISD